MVTRDEFFEQAALVAREATELNAHAGDQVLAARDGVLHPDHGALGDQRFLAVGNREGQVDRFYKRLQVRQDIVAEKRAASESKTSPERPISEFKLTTKAVSALAKAGINTAGDVLAKLEGGEKVLLEVEGFGRKSLIDLKKQLRQMGYQLPAAAEEIEV